jgi:hypothetical protein
MSALIVGVVQSTPFRMRMAAAPEAARIDRGRAGTRERGE